MLSHSLRNRVSSRALVSRITTMAYSTSAPAEEDDVIFSNLNNTKVITLNRPRKLNALNESMILKLHPRLQEYAKSEITDLIIQKSDGRAFCAGGDVSSCVENNLAGNSKASIEFFQEEYSLNYLLATYPKPVVTFQNGITMGGGVGLSIHTPFRIATENTVWAMPEMDIGFSPDVGTTFALNKVVPSSFGWYLALTGKNVKGWDTYFAGISTHYVPADRLPELEKELTRVDLKRNPNLKFEIINSTIENFTEPFPKDYHFEYSPEQFRLIDDIFHSDASIESIFEALETNGSEFAKTTLETLKRKSPLSLKVALEILQRGKKTDIYEALTNELNAAKQFMEDSDFNEGVSSKLIRKSKDLPNWKFKTPQEVAVKELLPFFKRDSNLKLYDHLGLTFNQYTYNFGLPKESEIEAFIKGESKSIDAPVSKNDVIREFVNDERYKHKIGLVKYLNFILDSKTEPVSDEGLKWKL